MSDEVTELTRKIEEIERKTAIWRSQVLVLLLVFVAGWIASAVWMTSRLEARAEKTEKVLAEKKKTVEAENFVVRDAAGKKWASFGMSGPRRVTRPETTLSFYDEKGSERTRLSPSSWEMFRPDYKHPVVFVLGDEDLSGLFLVDPAAAGETVAFAACITKAGGYEIRSRKPVVAR